MDFLRRKMAWQGAKSTKNKRILRKYEKKNPNQVQNCVTLGNEKDILYRLEK